jgi:hypothetical protein
VSLADTETGEIVHLLDRAEADALTAKIKSYAGSLWRLLGEAHDRQAWRSLGYSSWTEYVGTEFDMSRAYAYRLVSHAKAVAELDAAAGIADPELSPMGDIPERALRGVDVNAAATAIAEAIADLPSGATTEQRAAVAGETIETYRRQTVPPVEEHPTPDVVPEHEEQAPTPALASVPVEGPVEEPPAIDPRDPMLVRRANASKALVKATDLFRLDPAVIAADTHPDDRADWAHFAEEAAEWAGRLAAAMTDTRSLRSVR